MKKQQFETSLPDGYIAVKVIDATDKKTVLRLNVCTLILTAAGMVLTVVLCGGYPALRGFLLPTLLIFLLSMTVYIVLHELVHGAVYKLFTRHSLTFGMTRFAAYCGVPDLYVYRKTALAAVAAPFLAFTVLFGAAILFIPVLQIRFLFGLLLSFHIGGCTGDLYDTGLFLFCLRDPDLLLSDTGLVQTFYLPDRQTPGDHTASL